ncbi:uncharacterized protein SAPINGB_P003177 [Magnusiomyces paraingens]|uniref:Major facilitator superfamily (MFS) profile domain-containing protein n=1 Tax=Magnusiomyces paraingens TaxID=2606893 RepID=A0A5E8BK90_9ASCO|nr:uncharacterized protein SAPINGB_P003177 [Saprochaete ingens]VVT51681.1 unnamed protein product [Saprochaete ingens]
MPRYKFEHQKHYHVYSRRVLRTTADHTRKQRQKNYVTTIPSMTRSGKWSYFCSWESDNSSTQSLEIAWRADNKNSSVISRELDQYNNYRHTWIPGLTHPSTAVAEDGTPSIPTMSYMVQNCADTGPPQDPYLVEWTGNVCLDFENVKLTTSTGRKLVYTGVICLAVVAVTCLSSVYSMAMPAITREFLGDDGQQPPAVVTLGLTLYLLGMAVGPLIFAPMSEVYGRRAMYAVSFFFALGYNFGCAFSETLGGLLTCRFLTGLFASGFLGIAAGTIADLYASVSEMQLASMLFTSAPVVGPAIGPMFAGSLVHENGGSNWRWCFHVMSMVLTAVYLLVVLVVPETCEAILLEHKAAQVRRVTENNEYYTARSRAILHRHKGLAEQLPGHMRWFVPMLDLAMQVCKSAQTPVRMLVHEPMLALLCGYSGLLLAVMYMFFVSYPRVFAQTYGFNLRQVGLAFNGLLCGALAAMPTVWINRWWVRKQ